jgi:predicted nucleotidyltransferase
MSKVIADYFKTQPVLKAWLFGSFARGEETTKSDVDILFVPDRSGKPFTLFTMGGMYMDLKELLGREVDLVEEGSLRPYAAESVNRDKILIYERKSEGLEIHDSLIL